MTGSQLLATAAVLVVNLQGSNVCASPRTVIVLPTTVWISATPPKHRKYLEFQNSLSCGACTLRHVYVVHLPANSVKVGRTFKLTHYSKMVRLGIQIRERADPSCFPRPEFSQALIDQPVELSSGLSLQIIRRHRTGKQSLILLERQDHNPPAPLQQLW